MHQQQRSAGEIKPTELEADHSEHTGESLTFNIWNESMWNFRNENQNLFPKKHLYKIQTTAQCRVAFHVPFGDSMGGMCVKGAKGETNAVGADLEMP